MKKLFGLLCCVMYLSVFSQENDNITLITQEMASPTQIEEARKNYNAGTEYLHNNDLENAEICFLKAIEEDSKFVDAMDHLGLVYRRQERYEDAIEMYKKSIEINSENTVPYINLAIVYKLQRRFEDARQEYLKILEFDKDNPEPYYGIGYLYYEREMYAQAIEYFEIAFSKYYNIESVYIFDASYLLAYANYYEENFEEALRYFKFTFSYYKDNTAIQEKILELEALVVTE